MNSFRSCAVIALVGCLALSVTEVSFGQAPASADPPVEVPQPTPAAPVPAAPVPAAPAQPLPPIAAQPLPTAGAQPVPGAPVQPLPSAPGPAAAPQQFPAAAAQPLPAAPVPAPDVPSLALIRGSHIIGSRAILADGVPIGAVQDLLSVAGSGEYVLIANPNGFVTIPRSLTFFEPVPRILQVNMTFAQVAELPRLLQISQLNRHFLERVHTFFRTPRGEAILQRGLAHNAKSTHALGGAQNRAETHSASKPAIHRLTPDKGDRR